MKWKQRADDLWALVADDTPDGSAHALGIVRDRDGVWVAELAPKTGGKGSLDNPADLSEEEYQNTLASLPEPLGPFGTLDEARNALEGALRSA